MGRRNHLAGGRHALTLLVVVLAVGCGKTSTPTDGAPEPVDRNADISAKDPFGEDVKKVVYLDQGWSPSDSRRFYWTTQGSQILPYDWFLKLEQADSDVPFRDNANMLRYRYLPQKPEPMNPDGLAVGFVKDAGRDRDWLGMTCAACHTSQVHYQGVAYRIDGAPTLADVTGFLRGLADALRATRDDPSKFDRFAKAILAGRDGEVARRGLTAQLTIIIDRRDGYNRRNFPPGVTAGFGRLDAFGAILNEVYHGAVPAKDLSSDTVNTTPADAPVSYPFLWDTPQHDKVQWNGSAMNAPLGIGSLARNAGEVIGVFADLDIPEKPNAFGYRSSLQIQNLRDLEDWLKTLWSPLWPDAFGAVDKQKATAGRALFEKLCSECHKDIDRKSPDRTVVAQMKPTGTDRRMSDNFNTRTGQAGKLEGSYEFFIPLAGKKIPAQAPGALMLHNVVVGSIIGSPFRAPADELSKVELATQVALGLRPLVAGVDLGPPYKGRPLNGIWATAPYLHNGSVPSLDALLKPVGERPKSFSVGSREFDPKVVGFKQDAKGFSTFNVLDDSGKPIPGNSNAGHEYGKVLHDDERAQLLEYLKSL